MTKAQHIALLRLKAVHEEKRSWPHCIRVDERTAYALKRKGFAQEINGRLAIDDLTPVRGWVITDLGLAAA